jgi:hypothetical protein
MDSSRKPVFFTKSEGSLGLAPDDYDSRCSFIQIVTSQHPACRRSILDRPDPLERLLLEAIIARIKVRRLPAEKGLS